MICPSLALVILAAPQGVPDPRESGLDPEKLSALGARFREFVDDSAVSGAVTLVARRGRVASLQAVGWRDLESRDPMKPDSIFRIASMTKPVTAIGIMMLEEEGKVSLEDPVEKHLPEFRGQMVIRSREGSTVTLAKPSRPITLVDLLTHTSGMPGGPPPGLVELYPRRNRSLAEAVLAFSQRPLEFEPGTKWSYSNTGMDTLGRVLEAVSGMPYEGFLAERLFLPLGMNDTFFFPSPDKIGRIAALYRSQQGKLSRVPSWLGEGAGGSSARYPLPAGGLYSTAADLFRLYQMMLERGAAGGRRYLKESTVQKMTKVSTGNLKAGFTPGMGFGLGWAVVADPVGVTEMLSPGTYGHGGAFGTQGWIDPTRRMIFVLLIQREGLPNSDASNLRQALQAIAVSAVLD